MRIPVHAVACDPCDTSSAMQLPPETRRGNGAVSGRFDSRLSRLLWLTGCQYAALERLHHSVRDLSR